MGDSSSVQNIQSVRLAWICKVEDLLIDPICHCYDSYHISLISYEVLNSILYQLFPLLTLSFCPL